MSGIFDGMMAYLAVATRGAQVEMEVGDGIDGEKGNVTSVAGKGGREDGIRMQSTHHFSDVVPKCGSRCLYSSPSSLVWG